MVPFSVIEVLLLYLCTVPFMCMFVCICMVYRNYHFCVFYIHHTTSLDIKACVFSSYIRYSCQFFKNLIETFYLTYPIYLLFCIFQNIYHHQL